MTEKECCRTILFDFYMKDKKIFL